MSTVLPTCPTDCDYSLQPCEADICNPNIAYGQINTLYLASRNAVDFGDWSLQAEWDARLTNTGTGVNDIRYLYGIGEKAASDQTETPISKGRIIYGKRTHKITFEVEDTGETNYQFIQYLQCGGFYKMWFQADKYLWGGNSGIEDVTIKVDNIIPMSDDEFQKFVFEITWKSQYDPERCELNPVA